MIKTKDDSGTRGKDVGANYAPTPSRNEGAPAFEPEKYRKYLADCDFSEKEMTELLGTLFNIMRSFVEIGFGVDSVQHVIPALTKIVSDADSNEVQQKEQAENFNRAARNGAGKDEGS